MENLNNINITTVNKSFSKQHREETRLVKRIRTETITYTVDEEYKEIEEQNCILTYLTFGLYKKKVEVPKTRKKEEKKDIEYEVEVPETIYIFDASKTRIEYLREIKTAFFEKQKPSSINGVNENKEETIKNIEAIFEIFNGEIQGFKENFDEFEKIVQDVENFILCNTGLK